MESGVHLMGGGMESAFGSQGHLREGGLLLAMLTLPWNGEAQCGAQLDPVWMDRYVLL